VDSLRGALLVSAVAAVALLAASAAPGPVAALAAAEELYERRADGSDGPACAPATIEAALDAYRQALAADPASLSARRGFLRAVFFRVGFCKVEPGPRSAALFEEAKRLGDDTVKRLLSGREGSRRERLVAAIRGEPLAAELFLWTAAAWGQWAVDHKIAAAWQGTAGKMRDLAEAVIAVAPETMDGGAHLILGRLHTEAPRIPLLTGWVSKEKGLAAMRAAQAIAPRAKQHLFFLGAALVEHSERGREEGLALLRRCAEEPVDPRTPVEDRHYVDKARRKLAAAGPARAAR
jgi:hypothetical protein